MTTGHDARECRRCGEILTREDILDGDGRTCLSCEAAMAVAADIYAAAAEAVLA